MRGHQAARGRPPGAAGQVPRAVQDGHAAGQQDRGELRQVPAGGAQVMPKTSGWVGSGVSRRRVVGSGDNRRRLVGSGRVLAEDVWLGRVVC